MNGPLGHHLITDRLPLIRLVDEYKCIDAVVLLVGEAVRRGRGGEGGGDGRMAGRELFEFRRLGGIRRARGQCQQQVAKIFTGGHREELERIDHHVGARPSGRRNLIAMPCGLAALDPSGRFGTPVESENRTVTGIVLPLNSTARLSPAASGDALKLPSTTMPLAWLARNPGCVPNALFIASTLCSSTG